MLACEENFHSTAKILLNAGADINSVSIRGKTPKTICKENSSTECFKLLLQSEQENIKTELKDTFENIPKKSTRKML